MIVYLSWLMHWQVGLNVDQRSNLPALQASSHPEVVTRPTASSSLLPPLPTTKPGKFSAPHGQLPRPGLRSRASIEKNLNTVLTVAERGSAESSQPGLPLSSLWNKRTSSLPVRTNALHPGSNADSNKGHSPGSETNLQCEVSCYPRFNLKLLCYLNYLTRYCPCCTELEMLTGCSRCLQ